jgi:peptide/nickel transport system substrate-binding protein
MKPIMTAATAMLAILLGAPSQAAEDELTIGLRSEPTSMDPHFHNVSTNVQVLQNIFQSLVGQDAVQKLEPELATEWKALDDTTWEFKLRDGVKFHDGGDFTANDVIYSVCRIPTVKNSPSSFSINSNSITDMRAKDPHTLIIKTNAPDPLLPIETSTLAVLSAKASGGTDKVVFHKDGCEGMGTLPESEAFNSPKVAVGTGPYRLEKYTRGSELALTRNDAYWGDKPEWKTVVMRPISSAGPRVAALLAGDVKMIESPPIQDIQRIKDAGYSVVDALSNRVIYLAMDQDGDAPDVSGTNGKNPLLDKKVREAISLSIDRDAIVKRIMGGVAEPAGELLPPPMFGTSGRKVDAYDPEKAKKLLAEAGYPNGFQIVLGTPNDRYINDAKVAQAIAQMLARVGIKVNVDASTASQFFSKRNNLKFPMFMAGWGSETGELSSALKALTATYDTDQGMGVVNAGRYSNPQMDEALKQAIVTIDNQKRSELLQKAETMVLDDYGIIPLHYERTLWALAPGLTYEPRVDQFTVAYKVKKGEASAASK